MSALISHESGLYPCRPDCLQPPSLTAIASPYENAFFAQLAHHKHTVLHLPSRETGRKTSFAKGTLKWWSWISSRKEISLIIAAISTLMLRIRKDLEKTGLLW